MTDEIDALEACCVEPPAEPACESGGRKLRPEPRQLGQVNAATSGEWLEDRFPPAPGA
jgi:hypothetical protein